MIFDVPHLEEHDVAVLGGVDTIRKELRFHLRSERRWHGTLRRQAKARAIRGSHSIEGISVTAEEAFAIVGGEDSAVDVDSTWLAVKGYSDAMTYAQILAETRESLNLDESTVRALHPLVQGAMAHLNLVMIHPFKDGNGRMSRILQSLMESAARCEGMGGVCADGALPPGEDGAATDVPGRPVAERVDDMVASGDAPERAVPALEHALSRWRLTNTIYRSLTGVSANTASRDLNALVRAGILERQGEKRGAWYRTVEDQRKAVEVERFFVDAVIDPADNPYRYLRRGQEVPVAGGEG